MSDNKYGGGIYDIKCGRKENKENFIRLPHQEKILNYYKDNFDNPDFRGMLLYHVLGSGKTCTSISIAVELIKQNKINKVYIFSPGSLRSTWVEQYCKKCGILEYIDNFIFVTYNYNFFGNKRRAPKHPIVFTDQTLIIIDETHNFINSVKNEAKVCTKLYTLILNCNSKILLLSGTPVYRDIAEFWFIGSILKPKIFGKRIRYEKLDNGKRGKDIGCKDCKYTDHKQFREQFDYMNENQISETGLELKEDIKSFISYFEGDETKLPKIIEHPPIMVDASKPQLTWYCKNLEIENFLTMLDLNKYKETESKERIKFLETLKIIANKNIFTRRIVNCYYPSYLACLKDIKADGDPIKKLIQEDKESKELFEETNTFQKVLYQEIVQRRFKILLAMRDFKKPFEEQYNEESNEKLVIEVDDKDNIDYLKKLINDIDNDGSLNEEQKHFEKAELLKANIKHGNNFDQLNMLNRLKEAMKEFQYEYNIQNIYKNIDLDKIDEQKFTSIKDVEPYYQKSFSLYKILQSIKTIINIIKNLVDESYNFGYREIKWKDDFEKSSEKYFLDWENIQNSKKVFDKLSIQYTKEEKKYLINAKDKHGMTFKEYLDIKIEKYKAIKTTSEREKLLVDYAKKYFEENLSESDIDIVNEYKCYKGKCVTEEGEEEEEKQEKDPFDENDYPDIREKKKYTYNIEEKMYDYGWVCPELLNNQELLQYSPKIVSLILKIISEPGKKQVVYSFFKNKSGVILIKNLLEKCINTNIINEKDKKSILLFSGDQKQSERQEILDNFNSDKNIRGEKYPVMLITDAGSEGINLLEVREYHIPEYSPVYNKISQAIGRARRHGSHDRLPENERTINVWYYWTVWPSDVVVKIPTLNIGRQGNLVVKEKEYGSEGPETMIDALLYEKGQQSRQRIDGFLNILKQSSIERN